VLTLTKQVRDEILAACLAGYPLEACGLLGGTVDAPAVDAHATGGPPTGSAVAGRSWTTRNAASSSRVYTVEPRDLLRADREAEDAGVGLVGVWHSHTHTDAYPSPTDIAAAPDPGWWYVLVSLRDTEPVVRAYRVRDGIVVEDEVAVG
jgi:proteasome lid subunit RPN8/RPN11